MCSRLLLSFEDSELQLVPRPTHKVSSQVLSYSGKRAASDRGSLHT